MEKILAFRSRQNSKRRSTSTSQPIISTRAEAALTSFVQSRAKHLSPFPLLSIWPRRKPHFISVLPQPRVNVFVWILSLASLVIRSPSYPESTGNPTKCHLSTEIPSAALVQIRASLVQSCPCRRGDHVYKSPRTDQTSKEPHIMSHLTGPPRLADMSRPSSSRTFSHQRS